MGSGSSAISISYGNAETGTVAVVVAVMSGLLSVRVVLVILFPAPMTV